MLALLFDLSLSQSEFWPDLGEIILVVVERFLPLKWLLSSNVSRETKQNLIVKVEGRESCSLSFISTVL